MKHPEENRLDKIWSQKIHAIWGEKCAMCGCKHGLSPHHAVKRRKHNVRWNLKNGFLLCQEHHQWSETHPALFILWLDKMFGKEFYENLKRLGNQIFDRDFERVERELNGEAL